MTNAPKTENIQTGILSLQFRKPIELICVPLVLFNQTFSQCRHMSCYLYCRLLQCCYKYSINTRSISHNQVIPTIHNGRTNVLILFIFNSLNILYVQVILIDRCTCGSTTKLKLGTKCVRGWLHEWVLKFLIVQPLQRLFVV